MPLSSGSAARTTAISEMHATDNNRHFEAFTVLGSLRNEQGLMRRAVIPARICPI
jgi:hypothetical protein